ncbi:MAG: hypothetical protein ABEJ44_02425 [Halanaeroarchaeum sp.]
MNRRTLLATLGTAAVGGLAGCLGGDADAKPRYAREISLVRQNAVPDGHEVTIEVELLASQVTPGQTARLRITTTNEGPKRAISIGDDDCGLINRSKGGSDAPPGLWLHDPDHTKYLDRNGNRWQADRPTDDPRGYSAYGCMRRTYEAGESLVNEYVLWDDYRIEGYMTPGTYRWEERVSVAETTNDFPEDDRLSSFTWGFSLRVDVPDS